MKLSIFTTITDPEIRGDCWEPAFRCYQELADEFVVMNGSPDSRYQIATISGKYKIVKTVDYKWDHEFSWEFIGQQFQRGYEACSGDWVIHCDLDFLFHQKDFGKIRQALKDYPSSPAISFYKWQFILPDRYNLKSRLILAVNKSSYGERIKFNGGGDLCQPTLDGNELNLDEMPQAGIPFYNYEKLTKTKEQIIDDVARMDRAYQRHFGEWLYSTNGTPESAYIGWLKMSAGRYYKPSKKIPLFEHPKYIQETIRNLELWQWGHDGFGLIRGKVYA